MSADPQFDALLISTADVLRRAVATTDDNYGQSTSALPTTVASAVPVRLSTKGAGREWKYDKKTEVDTLVVFLNVPTGWELTNKDWFLIDGIKYGVTSISDPSNLHHHLEATVEVLFS